MSTVSSSTVSANVHVSALDSTNLDGANAQISNSDSARSGSSASLEELVRIALFNKELAPGVAKQIEAYRSEQLNESERRLLTILDDAIADKCIVVIQPNHQPTPQPVFQPTALPIQSFALCNIS